LGEVPSTEREVAEVEGKLGVKLPEDYKEFLRITNGFSSPNDIEPSFERITEIDYLKNFAPEIIDAYDVLPELDNAIIVGAKLENEDWRYWKFANWYPGEHEFENLKEYFKNVLSFIVEQHEN